MLSFEQAGRIVWPPQLQWRTISADPPGLNLLCMIVEVVLIIRSCWSEIVLFLRRRMTL